MATKKPTDKAVYTSNQDISFRDKEGNMIGGIEAGFKPYSGRSEYLAPNPSTAGAGRGKQGGPTARQADENRATMSSAERAARDEAKAMKEQAAADKAYEASRTSYKKGGMTASSRADGIAQRGKTRGTMIMCGGGYMKGKK